jgi:hypothetical protein
MFWPVFLLVVGLLVLLLLWRWGTFTPAGVKAWRRIGAHHHLTDDRPLEERVGDRIPSLARFFRETSVPRLLRIANRRESLQTWLLRVTVYALLATIAALGLDLIASVSQGQLPLPPLICVLLGALFAPLAYLSLQQEARARQAALNRAVNQSLTEMAILTQAGQYTVSSALELLARCHRDPALFELLTGPARERVAAQGEVVELSLGLRSNQLLSTITIYERLAREYDLEALLELTTNMRRIAEKGLVPANVLTSLSSSTGKRALAELAVRSEQARPRMALAIGLMVVPLLSLILFPTASAITTSFH